MTRHAKTPVHGAVKKTGIMNLFDKKTTRAVRRPKVKSQTAKEKQTSGRAHSLTKVAHRRNAGQTAAQARESVRNQTLVGSLPKKRKAQAKPTKKRRTLKQAKKRPNKRLPARLDGPRRTPNQIKKLRKNAPTVATAAGIRRKNPGMSRTQARAKARKRSKGDS